MSSESTIKVASLLGKAVHTREATGVLLQAIEASRCSTIELDFANVEFISRSFADQLYNDRLEVEAKHNKTIAIANAGEMVTNMLEAVARTQNRNNRKEEKIPVIRFSNMIELEDFFRSIQ